MKIAIFIPSFAGGGGQKAAVHVANNLAQEGQVVDLLVAEVSGPFLSNVSKVVNIVDLDSRQVSWAFPRLLRYLGENHPDVLLSFQTRTNFFSIAAKLVFRDLVVIIREGNTPSLNLKKSPLLRDRIQYHLIPIIYPWADGIVAISSGVAEDLRQLLGEIDITVIYNPCYSVELADLSNIEISHPWLNSPDHIVLVAVGRLSVQKDHRTMLQALLKVREKVDAKLLILGIGSEEANLKQLARDLGLEGHVEFLGFVQNPYPYMREADLFVQSSRWEGFGIALVEAMACGTPVISTDCPSGPREILADGEFGELVKPRDSLGLAEAIIRTIKNPLAAKVLINRAKVFSVEKSVAAYYQIIKKLVEY